MSIARRPTFAPQLLDYPRGHYLKGSPWHALAAGFLATVWIPLKLAPVPLAWTFGAVLMGCGAMLAGSALLRFKIDPACFAPAAADRRYSGDWWQVKEEEARALGERQEREEKEREAKALENYHGPCWWEQNRAVY